MIGSLFLRAHSAFLALCGKKAILNAPAVDPVAEADARWLAARAACMKIKPEDDRGLGEARRAASAALHDALRASVAARRDMRSA